ncbi:hypothetical protein PR048_015631 [Dryococelus australis]|uniref:Uncharacterized protein n=1 Tax=Dryococelus australis TaxID=614101 RepID=A0ABQ9HHP6_9NEOP|nr:hypothetical protein PR048_015631 [Dryococelus australis]
MPNELSAAKMAGGDVTTWRRPNPAFLCPTPLTPSSAARRAEVALKRDRWQEVSHCLSTTPGIPRRVFEDSPASHSCTNICRGSGSSTVKTVNTAHGSRPGVETKHKRERPRGEARYRVTHLARLAWAAAISSWLGGRHCSWTRVSVECRGGRNGTTTSKPNGNAHRVPGVDPAGSRTTFECSDRYTTAVPSRWRPLASASGCDIVSALVWPRLNRPPLSPNEVLVQTPAGWRGGRVGREPLRCPLWRLPNAQPAQ